MTVLNVKDFGAMGDAKRNDTDAIQDAIDTASAIAGDFESSVDDGGVTVVFPRGTYRIEDTLTWKTGVHLRGEYGSTFVGPRYPEISWFGTTSKAMIETETGADHEWWKIERLILRDAKEPEVGTARPLHGLVFKERTGVGTCFTDFAVSGCDGNGIRFEKGGMNVHCHRFRTDGCLDHAIYWNVGGVDTLSLVKFTVDNVRTQTPLLTSGGALRIDGTSAAAQDQLRLSVRDCLVEIHNDLDTDDACFKLEVDPSVSHKLQLRATFDTVYVAPEVPGQTVATGFRCVPATDFVDLTLRNCQMSVEGIPTYARSTVAPTSDFHTFTAINPHGVSANVGLAGAQSANELYGDLNVQQFYQHGETSVQTMQATTSDFDAEPVSIPVGQWLLDPAPYDGANTGRRVAKECTQAGTLGTLTGVTGEGIFDDFTLTVSASTPANELEKLKLGQWITIGSDKTRITRIDATNSDYVLTLADKLTATYSSPGTAVSFTAPLFIEHTLVNTYPDKEATWNPGSLSDGAGETSSAITVTGAAFGDFVTVSAPYDLQGIMARGYVSASDTVKIRIQNETGSTIDLGSGTWRVRVFAQE